LPQTFEQMRRVGWIARLVTEVAGEKVDPVVLEGSEYFPSTQLHCAHGLQQRQAHGETHDAPLVVGATVTRAGSHAILPLAAEEVGTSDEEQEPQDCELTAAQRLVKRLRTEHRQLARSSVGDELYGHEPLIAELQRLRRRLVRVANPSSPPARFAQVADREQPGEGVRGTWSEGTGPRRRTFTYRTAADLALTQAGAVRVNFLAVWEQRPESTGGFHNSWVTDFVVTLETVAALGGIGRSRGKSEKAQCNVQKNHGSELEPNDGHGQQTLSLVFYRLNRLAFLAHKLLELGERLSQQCRVEESRRGLWTLFRSAF